MARVGAVFPQLEIGSDPGAIRAYAAAVEDLGYEHLLIYDHVVGADTDRPDPRIAQWPASHYTYRDEFHEPLVLFGFLAAVTARIELVTSVLVLPQRQTVLAAKQAAEVQILSGGRLRLGVGVGYNHLEYEALGVPFAERPARLEEQIAVMRQLWRSPLVDLDGAYHHLDRVGLSPLPEHPIPIWMGATSPAGFRRVVALADGWLCPGGILDQPAQAWLGQLQTALAAAGPRDTPFGVDGRIDLRLRNDEEVKRELACWEDAGATHVSVSTLAPPSRRAEGMDVDGHIRLLERAGALIGLKQGEFC